MKKRSIWKKLVWVAISLATCAGKTTTEVFSTDTLGAAVSQNVKYFRQQKIVILDQELSENLRVDLKALLATCTHRSKKRVLESDWQVSNFANDSLHLSLDAAESVTSKNGQAITVSEILLTFPNQQENSLQQNKPDQTQLLARHLQTLYSPFFGCDKNLLNKIRDSLP